MELLNRYMLVILSLDSDASLKFSPMTGKWYVSARIEISDGAVLSGVAKHDENPTDAVVNFMFELCRHTLYGQTYVIVGAYTDRRIAYQWNGAAFTVVTQVS